MRAAQIENGKAVNVVIVDQLEEGQVLCDEGGIGDSWDGHTFQKPRPAFPSLDEYEAAVQAHLDTIAQAHDYDNVLSACSYAAAPNQFQAESIAFITWRGACWTRCHVVLNAVNAGTMEQPTIPELLATLPTYGA